MNATCQNSKSQTARRVLVEVLLCSCALMYLAAGCKTPPSDQITPAQRIAALTQEKTDLTQQLQQSESKNEQLQKDIKRLSGIRDQVRFKDICRIAKIKLTKRTGLYDEDKDGKAESLIVCIQPVDRDSDTLKALGVVDIQLWDLNNEAAQAKLGQWHTKPHELEKRWFTTLMGDYFKLTFDAPDKAADAEGPLTVKVTFIDYLTGKQFQEQKPIKPQ